MFGMICIISLLVGLSAPIFVACMKYGWSDVLVFIASLISIGELMGLMLILTIVWWAGTKAYKLLT